MTKFITKASLLLLLAVSAMAYNPHDPHDSVMFARRLRAGTRSLNKGGNDNKKKRATRQRLEPPSRKLETYFPGSTTLDPSGSSCAGNCGEGLAGCWCDAICQNYGDCCDDVCDECGFCDPVQTDVPFTTAPSSPGSATQDPSGSSCAGNCGEGLAGCWCDAACQSFGDCCDDVCDECGFCGSAATPEPSSSGTFPPPVATPQPSSSGTFPPPVATSQPSSSGTIPPPVASPVAMPVSVTLDCSFQDDFDASGDGMVLVRRVINQVDETVTVEVEYAGEGWIGFAFSEQPEMVPNIAVIGLPGTGAVEKYDLQERALTGVTPIGTSTLTSASITQANGITTLAFTKPLVDAGEPLVVSGENRFNWAVGSSNELGFHASRGSVLANFDVCLETQR